MLIKSIILANYTPPDIPPKAKLVFDTLKFTFNTWPTHITIAWKFENNQSCTPPVTFTIQSSTCDVAHPTISWNTTNLEYSLPLMNDEHYLTIIANDSAGNECTRTLAKFQVVQNCKI